MATSREDARPLQRWGWRANGRLRSPAIYTTSGDTTGVPVTDDRGRVCGWVTLADISRKLLVESRDLQDALSRITEPDRASES